MAMQDGLFAELESTLPPTMPEGFRYEEDIFSEAEQAALVTSLARLELKPFEFHGHLGNRRVTSFGLRYDYVRRAVEAADGFPSFVAELRRRQRNSQGERWTSFSKVGSTSTHQELE